MPGFKHSAALLSAILLSIALPTQADSELEDTHVEHAELDTVTVSALPMARSKLESAQPVDLLFGEDLDDRRGLSLGETLMRQPGVHSTAYGAGAGRPIIRGLGGARVRVLEDSLPAVDVSAQSDDHAVGVEPMLVDRIEIMRGPATLLFGSGAVGGVVNVVDGRIPDSLPGESLSGRYELRGNTVADERTGVLRLDGGGGQWAWNVSAVWRDSDDYRIPAMAEAGHHEDDGHDHLEDESGRLPNSFVESQSGSAGLSWIGARGFLGASIKRFESEYGIPAPHGHGHEDDHDHGHHQDDERVYIDLEQTRWDLKGGLDRPLPGFERASLRMSYSDYRHAERAIETGEHGHGHDHTVFDLDAFHSRLELEHVPLAGWRGAVGFQFEDESLSSTGEEALVPDGDTQSWAVFVLEEKRSGEVTWTLGGRMERNRIRLDQGAGHDHDHDGDHDHAIHQRSFTTWSASAGALWQINDYWQSSLNYSFAERAPSQGDLFADGAHLATFGYERGDPDLRHETTQGLDFIVHRHSEAFDIELSLFYNDIEDFIHLYDTGTLYAGLPFRQTRQQDARFHGGEITAIWHLPPSELGHFDLRAGHDRVRGQLRGGQNLPRIAPRRYTAAIDWHRGPARASVEYQRVSKARHLAPEESAVPGYDMLDLHLGYHFRPANTELEVFAKLSNLLDEEARPHTSYLKNFAPLPGRNLTFGLRGRF